MSLQPCSALLGPHVREISLIQRCAWLLSPPEGQAHEVVGFFLLLVVVVVAFSSLARIWGERLTIHSPLALFFFFF